MRPVPIVLDVDTGVDDALAIGLAVRSPEIDLAAVTTLAGNVDIERATQNSLAVLDWLGASRVPVHRGASRPLVREHKDAVHVHGGDGLGNAGLPVSSRSVASTRGPAEMVRLANTRPGEMTLVCVGPLTNLAIALNVEPRLPELIDRVVVMGGAFTVPGNVTSLAEFNIFADPEAAAQVFAASFPRLTVVGLDVTHQVALPKAVWEAAALPKTPASELAVRVCRRTFTERGMTGFYLHDPLAVAVAADPTLVTTTDGTVEVILNEHERGMTRLSGRGTVQVATAVDGKRFLGRFYRALDLPAVEVDQASLLPE